MTKCSLQLYFKQKKLTYRIVRYLLYVYVGLFSLVTTFQKNSRAWLSLHIKNTFNDIVFLATLF